MHKLNIVNIKKMGKIAFFFENCEHAPLTLNKNVTMNTHVWRPSMNPNNKWTINFGVHFVRYGK